MHSTPGSVLPFSQLMMVNSDTPSCSPTSFWVSLSSCLFCLRCSPRVFGARNLGVLRVTRTNGKRATRLCPCGFLGEKRCRCTAEQIARYRGKLSGLLLDRIDLMIEVPAVTEAELSSRAGGEPSAQVRQRVVAARARQMDRQGKTNAGLTPDEVDRHCLPDCQGAQLLKQVMQRLQLSARAYHRVLKVARTVADLAGATHVGGAHVAEAIHYRRNFQ